MSWLETILAWDQAAFNFIHNELKNSFFDNVIPPVRHKYFWIPVYAGLIYFALKKYGKTGLLWVLAYLLVFAICDGVSAGLMKPFFARIRPCNDPALQAMVTELVHCGSGFSFPSAHSSNHFGMSFFIIFTLGRTYKWMIPAAWAWAILVVFAQVYVGVHYPLDILGGFFVGLLGGGLVSYLFNKFVPFQQLKINN